jgi:hypothetical protein
MIDQKDEETQDDRGRDGRTNFILRIKEQETHLTLLVHDDDVMMMTTLLPFLTVTYLNSSVLWGIPQSRLV